jgi:EAL domain-containing protein (putative c-di-GMP-specific phosphodiesterase class I)
MNVPFKQLGCRACLEGAGLSFEFTMAFQPIVDTSTKTIFAHEALVRGIDGAGAADILGRVDDHNRYAFDQACRVKAISLAKNFDQHVLLSINFLPNAVYRPETCIRATLEAAVEFNFPAKNLMFEVTESEPVADPKHLMGIFREYKRQGFTTAIDDFGAGQSGLNLLADFQPDILKLDMALTRGIDADRTRRAIVRGAISVASELNIRVVAEGIETIDEFHTLGDLGVSLFQGYLFARPQIGKAIELDQIQFPD